MIDYKSLGLTYKAWIGVWVEALKVFLAGYVTYMAAMLESGQAFSWIVFSLVLANSAVSVITKWLEYLRTDTEGIVLTLGETRAILKARGLKND